MSNVINEQQTKVINKINRKSGTADKLMTAKKNANDEFYTSLKDIGDELNQYPNEIWDNKDIILPCDCDIIEGEEIYSIRIEFDNHTETGYFVNRVAKVSYSLFDEPETPVEITGSEADEFIRTRVTCNFLRFLRGITVKRRGANIHSITASGYDVFTNKGVDFADVDYSKYDICITNPPFSKLKQFMKIMTDEVVRRRGTDRPFNFIILTPMLNRVSPMIGNHLMDRICYLGFGRTLGMQFNAPTAENNYKTKSVCVDWLTTYDFAQKEVDKTRMQTFVNYDTYKDKYPIMPNMTMRDGSHPIRVKDSRIIPDNYYGWIFCSIQVLKDLSYDEWEWDITGCKKYFNTTHPELNPFTHKLDNVVMLTDADNKQLFHGIIMRRKPQN